MTKTRILTNAELKHQILTRAFYMMGLTLLLKKWLYEYKYENVSGLKGFKAISSQNRTTPTRWREASSYHRCPGITPVTNEAAMASRLLAEVANGIIGTGQVCSTGGNLTPPDGTEGRKERVCPGLCVFASVCFC